MAREQPIVPQKAKPLQPLNLGQGETSTAYETSFGQKLKGVNKES